MNFTPNFFIAKVILLLCVFYENFNFYEYHVAAQRSLCPVLTLPNGRIRIRSGGRTAKFNCFRGFQLLGPKYATCLRGKWDTELPICVRPGCSPISYLGHGIVLESYRGAVLKFICNPGYTLAGSDIIYCNGTSWNASIPLCKIGEAAPKTSCDFETEDLCGWNQDPNHHVDWRRHSYSTPSGHVGTGPSYDHTLGEGKGGHYLYIETSSPRMENDSARLFSPVYSAQYSKDACFMFWYHMFGATTGYLQIYIKPEGVDLSEVHSSWRKFGDQGNQWYEGYVPIEPMKTSFQIIIEALRGPGYVSDTAIDDLNLASGSDCVVPTTTTSETTEITSNIYGNDTVHLDDDQSCRKRCSDNISSSTMYPKLTTPPHGEVPVLVSCDCHLGCLEEHTCCPDYSQYCVQALVTLRTTNVPSNVTIQTTSMPEIRTPRPLTFPPSPPLPPLPPHPASSSTSQTITTYNNSGTTIKQKITSTEIHLTKESTTYRTTQRPTIILPTLTTTTTNINTVTTFPPKTLKPSSTPTTRIPTRKPTTPKPIRITTLKTTPSTRPTTVSPTTSTKIPRTTAPSTTSTKKVQQPTEDYIVLPDDNDNDVDDDDDDKDYSTETDSRVAQPSINNKATIIPTSGIIGIVVAIAMLFGSLITITWFVVRRRRKFRRQCNVAEDSDIRFLTSDEQLNFEIAQPKYDDGL